MFRSSSQGQGLVECALILVLAILVIIAAISLLGPNFGSVFTSLLTQ
jgi:Flp pilus assembly pilin Flp